MTSISLGTGFASHVLMNLAIISSLELGMNVAVDNEGLLSCLFLYLFNLKTELIWNVRAFKAYRTPDVRTLAVHVILQMSVNAFDA